ncbi:uncharacterized protein LOC112166624 [Rosa chinensis]|uniref:uncharacterized protein LOC112166624 n=1 Tax=Rosa chinensis TaxID=74649 RepID=UPI000D086F82|nr:uncharacterized protein LOC112166624 [Rosa chinensis]
MERSKGNSHLIISARGRLLFITRVIVKVFIWWFVTNLFLAFITNHKNLGSSSARLLRLKIRRKPPLRTIRIRAELHEENWRLIISARGWVPAYEDSWQHQLLKFVRSCQAICIISSPGHK